MWKPFRQPAVPRIGGWGIFVVPQEKLDAFLKNHPGDQPEFQLRNSRHQHEFFITKYWNRSEHAP